MIRHLERADYQQVYEILQRFAGDSGILALQNRDLYDYTYIKKILLQCETTGFSWVSVDNKKIQGFFLSLIVSDLWVPSTLFLREIAWYVLPEYRNTSAGARLYARYKRNAEYALQNGRISGYTITRLASSPPLDYEKSGFRFIEATYMIGD